MVAPELTRWQGIDGTPVERSRRTVLFGSARQLVSGHTSLRSVWFLNSARGAVALAVAVAVADLTNVQHAFWVVLGTLSVLRTNAAATGATALRAIAGTVVGFFIGGALILAIGAHPAALWAALPVAVLIASYSPGTLPFAVGQAGFTVTISILFNILVPVGWKVGVVRVEDVAIGAAVSALVGVFSGPEEHRGSSATTWRMRSIGAASTWCRRRPGRSGCERRCRMRARPRSERAPGWTSRSGPGWPNRGAKKCRRTSCGGWWGDETSAPDGAVADRPTTARNAC